MNVATDQQCKQWRKEAAQTPRLSKAALAQGKREWDAWVAANKPKKG